MLAAMPTGTIPPDSMGDPVALSDGPTLAAQAYERLRQDIVDGTFLSGEALSEARMATRYGISRTPMREAIKQLAKTGLVRLVPSRGAFVAELAPHDVVEIYQLREQLDGLATRMAAALVTDAELKELRAETDQAIAYSRRDEPRRAFDLAIVTHRRITRISSNGRLLRILEHLEDEARRLSHLTFRSPGRLSAALREHQQIVKALSSRDPELAQELMCAHLRADRDAALAQLRGGRVT
jgi:DNA-binding GntR family transcriptional regulator